MCPHIHRMCPRPVTLDHPRTSRGPSALRCNRATCQPVTLCTSCSSSFQRGTGLRSAKHHGICQRCQEWECTASAEGATPRDGGVHMQQHRFNGTIQGARTCSRLLPRLSLGRLSVRRSRSSMRCCAAGRIHLQYTWDQFASVGSRSNILQLLVCSAAAVSEAELICGPTACDCHFALFLC
jgi:hypothetical protein